MEKKLQSKISSNITFTDNLLSIFLVLNNKIKWFFNFQKAFQNYFSVIKKLQNNSYPISAILKNGERIILNSRNEVSLYSLLQKNKNCIYFPETDSVVMNLSKNGKKSIKLFGIKKNFDTILAFEDNTYDKIPIKDLVVVDIGTSIGDTPIYFALQGATKVIGLEPFPQNYEFAVKNVKENNLEDKIHLLLAGCAGKENFINVDPSFESDMRSITHSSKNGTKIPMLTLNNIIKKFNVNDGVLKMDCEGCEYDAILSAENHVLRKFQYIQVEYHFGYKNIKEKLEDAGFRVTITKIESYFKNGKIDFFRGHVNGIRI